MLDVQLFHMKTFIPMDGDIDGFINAYLTGLATGDLKK